MKYRHFLSHKDLPGLIDVDQVCKISSVLAKSVLLAAANGSASYEDVRDKIAPAISVNCTLVSLV
jgi:hypothetical protein